MTECAVTLALEFGASQPYVARALKTAPAVEYADGIWKATTDYEEIPLTNPPMVRGFDRGEVFAFIEPGQRDPIYKQIPDVASANYVDLIDVVWVPDTSGPIIDALVNSVLTDPTSDSYATLLQFVLDHPGPTGPPGPRGGDDAIAYAQNITDVALTLTTSHQFNPNCSVFVPADDRDIWIEWQTHIAVTVGGQGSVNCVIYEATGGVATLLTGTQKDYQTNQANTANAGTLNGRIRVGSADHDRVFCLYGFLIRENSSLAAAFRNLTTWPTWIQAVAQ